jgi:hypothetical protein
MQSVSGLNYAPVISPELAVPGLLGPARAFPWHAIWSADPGRFGWIPVSQLIRSHPARFFGTIGFRGPDRAVHRLDRKPT